MRRREFITLVGATAAWPLVAQAQQPERVRRIGVLQGLAADDPEAQAYAQMWEHVERAHPCGLAAIVHAQLGPQLSLDEHAIERGQLT